LAHLAGVAGVDVERRLAARRGRREDDAAGVAPDAALDVRDAPRLARQEGDGAELDPARLLLVRLLLPALDRVLRRVVELRVDVDLPVRVEPERDEVLLELAHVEAVVDPVLEGAPGRLAAREPEHGPRVDAVEDRAGAHER